MEPVLLDLPGPGPWEVHNSPARRVPSHGTHRFGTTYAIDLVPVDARGRSAPATWRTLLATEAAADFVGFGLTVTAPCAGTVVAVHDGEEDHAAHRSPVAYLRYAAGQGRRARSGAAAVAGNHVVIETAGGALAAVCHLRRGSVCVTVDEQVTAGARIGACGNSGNSIQPHVHLQVCDSPDLETARGLPIVFRSYQDVRTGTVHRRALPTDGDLVRRDAAGSPRVDG